MSNNNFDRFDKADELFREIIAMLPNVHDEYEEEEVPLRFWTNGEEILSTNRAEIETIADLFDQLYGTCTMVTGYYDPEEDKRNGEDDANTGFYYCTNGD